MADFLWVHADDLRPHAPMAGMGIQVVRTADYERVRTCADRYREALECLSKGTWNHGWPYGKRLTAREYAAAALKDQGAEKPE